MPLVNKEVAISFDTDIFLLAIFPLLLRKGSWEDRDISQESPVPHYRSHAYMQLYLQYLELLFHFGQVNNQIYWERSINGYSINECNLKFSYGTILYIQISEKLKGNIRNISIFGFTFTWVLFYFDSVNKNGTKYPEIGLKWKIKVKKVKKMGRDSIFYPVSCRDSGWSS